MTSSFQGLTVDSTGALTLPLGTTAQRPGYTVTSFTSGSGSWSVPTGVTSIEVLVVAGGGGGGKGYGGGGGGGGVVYNSNYAVTPTASVSYSIGSGGAAGNNQGGTGVDTTWGTITAIGGGGGGGGGGSGSATSVYGNVGGSGGGSSGFSGGGNTDGPNPAASGTPGQGWPGGRGGSYPTTDGGGGGGGSGGTGTDCQNPRGGDGGTGTVYDISGSAVMYGSGGGGNNVGIAQSGGGNGSSGSNTAGSGTANTGGGGGGSYSGGTPGSGGSGIVIIRYSTNTATTGMVRYNTTLGELEGFANGTWNTLGHNTSLATGMVFLIDAANPKSSKAGSPGIKDLCGANHIGQLNNSSGITWTPSAGGAWYFDGTGHAKFPTNATAPYINVTGNISVNLWCYIIGGYYIVTTGSQTSSTGFAISYQNGSPFVSVSSTTKSFGGGDVVTMPTGRWVNLCIAYNSTTPSMNYYINGTLSQSSWGAAGSVSYTPVYPNLTLGVPNNATSNYQFNGYISHLSIWSRQLSATEVATNFSALKTRHNV
jgi:hypothetical protein